MLSLDVVAPATITPNVPFNVEARVMDGTNNVTAANDRMWISVNRLGQQSKLPDADMVVRFNGLRATSVPVMMVVTCPTRNLSKTIYR